MQVDLNELIGRKVKGPKGRFLVPFEEGQTMVFGEKPENPVNIVLLDTETTGFTPKNSEIIELAAVGMKVCKDTGRIYSVGTLFDYFNQPSSPIPPKITEITGITNADVEGHKIDLTVVAKWLRKADIIVAHNATFDRPFVDSLPLDWDEIVKPWGCSCHDPNWLKLGAENRKLEDLLTREGYEYSAHRAIYDCLATAFLLALHPDCMMEILQKSLNDTYRVSFSRTPYGSNPLVKDAGYAFANNSWTKYYLTMEDMLEERQGIVDNMRLDFGKTPNVAVNHTAAISRFSSGY